MMRQKKRCMTLLELLIAMSLTIMIITAMTYFFRQIDQINLAADRLQEKSFQMRFVESRLMDTLPKAVSFNNKKRDFAFFTTQDTSGLVKPGTQSLYFTFDNCVNLDPNFASHVLGKLYLDPSARLTLALWPSYKRWKENELPPMKKEILLENVDDISFSFFVPPEKEKRSLGLSKPKEKLLPVLVGEWLTEWRADYKQLPAIMKVVLTIDGKKWTFAVPLPKFHEPVVYDR